MEDEIGVVETREGMFCTRILPDGREASVMPLLFGRARIVVGERMSDSVDDGW